MGLWVEGVLPVTGWPGKALLGRPCVSEQTSPGGIRGKNVPAEVVLSAEALRRECGEQQGACVAGAGMRGVRSRHAVREVV